MVFLCRNVKAALLTIERWTSIPLIDKLTSVTIIMLIIMLIMLHEANSNSKAFVTMSSNKQAQCTRNYNVN